MKYVAVLEPDNNVIIRGDLCCTDLKSLYEALVDRDTTEIEISKEFSDAYFTYTALCDFVENSATIAPNVRIVVNDTFYTSTLQAARELKFYRNSEDLVYAIEYNPDKIISTIQTLCDFYLNSHDESVSANNKLATMAVQLEEANQNLEREKTISKNALMRENEKEAKLKALVNRVNFKYDKTVNPDEMFILKENKYNHVLYIKEITRVHYTDTLVYYLKEILKTLYGVPARTVVIEPYYAYGRESLYPMFKPHWNLTYSDVYSGDIMMAGFQPKLMKDILQDSSHVQYLIVLDRGGYMTPHIEGGNVSVVYTASDMKDVPENIHKDSVISYEEDTLNIPYIEDFDKLSPEAKIQKYSSMKVIQRLINILEEVSGDV